MRSKELRNFVFHTANQGETAEPRCRHFGECGGCAFQDRAYTTQLAAKLAGLQALWAAEDLLTLPGLPPLEVVPSPEPYAYRTRMDYVASRGRFGLRRRNKFNWFVDLSECHLLPDPALPIARQVYAALIDAGIPDYDVKTHAGFLRYIVVRRSFDDELLLALVTATTDHAPVLAAAAALALEHPQVVGVWWLLNATLTDLSFGEPLRHWGSPTLNMRVGDRYLQIGPNTFFQNNVYLLPRLLADLHAYLLPDRPLADLYGGVGTIAIALADKMSHVVSVESVAESAALAANTIAAYGITNVEALACEVLPFLSSQAQGAFPTIVVDPPRIGLGPEVCRELVRLAPERLIYISCNPLTQRDDYRVLRSGFRPVVLRGYDMFPQTPHLEALLVLEQNA